MVQFSILDTPIPMLYRKNHIDLAGKHIGHGRSSNKPVREFRGSMRGKMDSPATWRPSKIDLLLSALIAVGFPALAGFLLGRGGALIPMLLYYGTAWALSVFRRGGSGYRLEIPPAPPASFYVNVMVILVALVCANIAGIRIDRPAYAGVILTALVWAPVNAASEQLLWLYIFDSWDLYGATRFRGAARLAMRGAGLALFTLFVGTIHTIFWARLLKTVEPASIFGIAFILATTISGFLHIVVWRRSGRMIYTFIPHFLLNLVPMFWTGYSMLPYLFVPVR